MAKDKTIKAGSKRAVKDPLPGLAAGREVKVHAVDEKTGDVFLEALDPRPALVDGRPVTQEDAFTIYRVTRTQFDAMSAVT